MGEFRAGSVQGLLGELVFRYILKSADEHGAPPALRHDTSHAAQVLHGAPRGHNPESKVDIRASHAACDHSLEGRQVLRVDCVPNHLHVDLGRGIELEDAERLLGPVVLVHQQIRDEAACLAEPLGFGKTKVSLLDLLLRPFSIVNIGASAIPPYDLPRVVAERLGANEKPAIKAIATSEARLGLV